MEGVAEKESSLDIDMDTYISKELDIGNILTLTSNHIPSPKQSYDKSPMGN